MCKAAEVVRRGYLRCMIQGNIAPIQEAPNPIDPGVRIGHVHLRTADIDRVRGFYVDVLGFDVVAEARDVPGWGTTGDILFVRATFAIGPPARRLPACDQEQWPE